MMPPAPRRVKPAEKPCRLWTGSNNRGYGTRRVNGCVGYVHRLAWEEAYGPIPDGMLVCHHCDTPGCYELTHLFLGTMRDNMRDAVAKGRMARGTANGRSRLTPELVAEIRATVRPNKSGHYGGGVGAAARRYGVHRSTLRQLLRGDSWQGVGNG